MEQIYDPLDDGFLSEFEITLFEQSVDADIQWFFDSLRGDGGQAEGTSALQFPDVDSVPADVPANINVASGSSATSYISDMPPQAVLDSSAHLPQADNVDTATSSASHTIDGAELHSSAPQSFIPDLVLTEATAGTSIPPSAGLDVSTIPPQAVNTSINPEQTSIVDVMSSCGASYVPALATGSRNVAKRRHSEEGDFVETELKRVRQTPDENIDPCLRELDPHGPYFYGPSASNPHHPVALSVPPEPYPGAGLQAVMSADYDGVDALGTAACGASQPVMGAYDTLEHAFNLFHSTNFSVPTESYPGAGAQAAMAATLDGVATFDAAAYDAPPPVMGAYGAPANVLALYNGHPEHTVPYNLLNMAQVGYAHPASVPFYPPIDALGFEFPINSSTSSVPQTDQPITTSELPRSSIIQKKAKKVTRKAPANGGTEEKIHKTPNDSGHGDPVDAGRQKTIDAHKANDARVDHTDAMICLWKAAAADEPCHLSFAGTDALLAHCVKKHGVHSAKTSRVVTSCLWDGCRAKKIGEGSLKRHLGETHGGRSRFNGKKSKKGTAPDA